MAKPGMKTLEQIPIYQTIRADRSPAVNAIISNLERGDFRDAALLSDGMMRDDRIAAVMHTRTTALASLPIELEPAMDSARARKIAADLESNWAQIFPDHVLAELIRWGQMIGIAIAQVHWDKIDSMWMPRLEMWHPRSVRWSTYDMKYYAYARQGEAEITPGNGWLLYTPLGLHYGWRRCLMLALSNLWLMRQWTWRDWARASEIYGMPIRKAIVPEQASTEDKDAFHTAIANIGNESAVRLPQSSDAKFDVELLESKSDMHKAFQDFLQELNTSIAITVLGQNLSTEVKGGSFAAAQTHEQVRYDRLGSDAETLAGALYEQVLRPWAKYNYGREDLAPWPQWEIVPPADKVQKAAMIKTLMEGLNLALQAGAPIDVRALLEDFSLPMSDLPDAVPTTAPPTETAPAVQPEQPAEPVQQ